MPPPAVASMLHLGHLLLQALLHLLRLLHHFLNVHDGYGPRRYYIYLISSTSSISPPKTSSTACTAGSALARASRSARRLDRRRLRRRLRDGGSLALPSRPRSSAAGGGLRELLDPRLLAFELRPQRLVHRREREHDRRRPRPRPSAPARRPCRRTSCSARGSRQERGLRRRPAGDGGRRSTAGSRHRRRRRGARSRGPSAAGRRAARKTRRHGGCGVACGAPGAGGASAAHRRLGGAAGRGSRGAAARCRASPPARVDAMRSASGVSCRRWIHFTSAISNWCARLRRLADLELGAREQVERAHQVFARVALPRAPSADRARPRRRSPDRSGRVGSIWTTSRSRMRRASSRQTIRRSKPRFDDAARPGRTRPASPRARRSRRSRTAGRGR